nr:DUF3604 domain-containing protein [Oceanicoccus sagamiensis]
MKNLWRDPDYDPNQSAFYYVRVLMNTTCRWSSCDAIRAANRLINNQRQPDIAAGILAESVAVI